MRLVKQLVAAGAGLVVALALGALPAAVAAAPAAAPQQVTITATEYAFDAPVQVDAGPVAVTYQNNGKASHNLKVWQLKEGKTLDDVKAARTADALFALVAAAYGGMSMTQPGASQHAVLDLPAGQLVLLSATRSTADGVPDFFKGLLRPITVVARPGGGAVDLPQADVAISLKDSGIGVPVGLGAGAHTVKVTNDGAQLHQAIILKLRPGKTAADFATAFKANQTGSVVDPAGANGGTGDLSPGQHEWITATFAPGDYVAFDDAGTSSFRDVPFPFTVSPAQVAQVVPSRMPGTGGGAASEAAPATLLLLAVLLLALGALRVVQRRAMGRGGLPD